MKTTCPGTNRGFSLVEVIIGVFVTGIIILVIANIPQAIKLITGSQSEAKVREVAAKIIEDARFAGFDGLYEGTTEVSDPALGGLNNVVGSRIITACPEDICTNNEEMKKVTVIISWEENTEPKSIRVVTLVGKGGLK